MGRWIDTHMCIRIYIHVCIYTYTDMHTYIHAYIYRRTDTCVYLMSLCGWGADLLWPASCVCAHTHTDSYMNTYLYVYIIYIVHIDTEMFGTDCVSILSNPCHCQLLHSSAPTSTVRTHTHTHTLSNPYFRSWPKESHA